MKDLIKALVVIVFSLSLLVYDHYNYKSAKETQNDKTSVTNQANIKANTNKLSSDDILVDSLKLAKKFTIAVQRDQKSTWFNY